MEELKKICPNCGTANLSDAQFCENCGTNLRNTAVQNFAPGSNYNPNNHAPMDSYGASPFAQPAPKKPIPKWLPVLIAEVAALALCIYGITGTTQKNKSPERIAENYFIYMANGDWEEGYSQMDAEDSEFINAEMFAKVHTQIASGIVTNYQINANPAEQAFNELPQELYDLAGDLGLGGYLEQGQTESSLEKVVQIDFRVKGDTVNSRYLVPLNQTSSGWKIMAGNYICKDYQIYVPAGASVNLDGIALGEEYLLPKEEEENYLDVYSIPQIFYGSHEIKITMEDMEDVAETIEIDYGSSQYRRENMQIKGEILDALIQKAGENMQQIYSAAMAGKNFQAIESLFTSSEESREEIKKSYEYLLSDLNEGSYLPTRVTFQNINGEAEDSHRLVNVSFEYVVDYKYESWGGGWKTSKGDGDEEWEFWFVKENGNWVQTNLGCETLYY